MKFDKKKAFTLTEVMLTITLLGFLATMTLSTVGSSVQQRARLAEFRTAYAKMDTALRNITTEEGKVYTCYEMPTSNEKDDFGLSIPTGFNSTANSECENLMHAFVKSMGGVRTCESDPVDEGCLPQNYPSLSTGGCFTNIGASNAYVLDNSMIIFDDNGNYMRKFAIDVNGRKGPNKWGQDIFPFSTKVTEAVKLGNKTYVKSIGILPPDTNCMNAAATSAASKTTLKMMRESAGIKDD